MAVICNSCGYAYNSDDAEHCSICNGDLRAGANIHSVPNSRLLSDQRQNGFATLQSGQSGLSASIDEEIQINRQYEPPEPPVPSSHTPENQPDNAETEQILEGRISHIERNGLDHSCGQISFNSILYGKYSAYRVHVWPVPHICLFGTA